MTRYRRGLLPPTLPSHDYPQKPVTHIPPPSKRETNFPLPRILLLFYKLVRFSIIIFQFVLEKKNIYIQIKIIILFIVWHCIYRDEYNGSWLARYAGAMAIDVQNPECVCYCQSQRLYTQSFVNGTQEGGYSDGSPRSQWQGIISRSGNRERCTGHWLAISPHPPLGNRWISFNGKFYTFLWWLFRFYSKYNKIEKKFQFFCWKIYFYSFHVAFWQVCIRMAINSS